MHVGRRRLVIAGAAGGLLLGAVAVGGTVLAQTSPGPGHGQNGPQGGPQAQEQKLLSGVAQHLGVTPAQLNTAFTQAKQDLVHDALQQGTITQKEADLLNQQLTAGNGQGGLGFDPSSMGARLGLQQVGGLQQAVQDAFKAKVGETQQDFFNEVRTKGQTPDQVFQAHNTSAQLVSQAEVTAATPLLDQAVKQGTITQAQASGYLAQLQRGPGFGGPGGPGGPPRGGPGPGNMAPASGSSGGSH